MLTGRPAEAGAVVCVGGGGLLGAVRWWPEVLLSLDRNRCMEGNPRLIVGLRSAKPRGLCAQFCRPATPATFCPACTFEVLKFVAYGDTIPLSTCCLAGRALTADGHMLNPGALCSRVLWLPHLPCPCLIYLLLSLQPKMCVHWC